MRSVPQQITCSSIEVSVATMGAGRTLVHPGACRKMSRPARSIREMANGMQWTPPFASVWYPVVMSSGLTATVPSVIG